MPKLETCPAGTDLQTLLDILDRDGALILADAIDPDLLGRVRSEIMPYVEATEPGRDEFTGRQTTRTGALVARSPACRELVMDDRLKGLCETFLGQYCSRHQLHLTQVIRIMPGQGAQTIHRDRWAWGKLLKGVEPQLNTIWAVTDFTSENGATQVVPGSTGWPDDRKAKQEEICQAEMKAGSVLIYTGSVFHGGGENRSNSDRIGINITYTLGWLRQEENQYLSCPPEIAATLDPELQGLIGYRQGSYALGYYSPPLPPGEGPEIVSPDFALGQSGGGSVLGSEELLRSLANQPGKE